MRARCKNWRVVVLLLVSSAALRAAEQPASSEWPASDALVSISGSTAAQLKLLGVRGTAQVEEMAWSPDEALLGLRSSSGLAVYRLDTGKGVRLTKERVLCEDRAPLSFSFVKGEDAVATCNGSKTITVWDIRSGWSKQEVKSSAAGITALAMSPVALVLAATTVDGKLCIWGDSSLEKKPQVLDDHKDGSGGITIDPRGKWAVTWGRWNTVHVWSLADGALAHSFNLGEEKIFRSVGPALLTPDGTSLWVGYMDSVRRWILPSEVATDDLRRRLIPRSTDFIHSEGKLCLVRDEQGASIASTADGKIVRKLTPAKELGPAAYQPAKGKLLALVSDGKLSLFDTRTAGKVFTEDLGSPCRIAALSPGGGWLVSGADLQGLEIADLKKGGKAAKLAGEAGVDLGSVVIDPRAKVLAGITDWARGSTVFMTGKRMHQLSLWQLEGKRLKRWNTLEKEAIEAGSLAFSPDGQWLGIGSWWQDPPVLRLFSLKTGKSSQPVRLPLGRSGSTTVLCVAFDTKSKLLASAVQSGRVSVLDVEHGKIAFDLPLPGEYPSPAEVAFGPSSSLLAVVSSSQVLIFDVPSRKLKMTLKTGDGFSQHIAFSPDGGILAATVSNSRGVLNRAELVLFETSSGSALQSLPAHFGSTNGVYFLADGKMIATIGDDDALRIWGVKKQAEPAAK